MRHQYLAAFSLLTMVFATTLSAQTLVSPSQAERYGLKRSWYAQAELTGVLDRVAHITPFVSSTQAVAMFDVEFDDTKFQFPVGAQGVKVARRAALKKHYDLRTADLSPRMYPIEIPGKDGAKGTPAYEVLVQKSKFRISQNDLDTYKKVLKVDGAKKKADETVKRLEKVGVKAKIKPRVVPKVTLIVSTENGRVQALDGETGRMLWGVSIGSEDHIMHKPSASDEFVAVTSGVTIHLLDIRDGQTKWTKRMKAIPGAGANISDTYVYVPMLRGRVESIRITEPRYDTRTYVSPGRVRSRPTFTPRSIVWSTEAGTVYVANANRKGMRYRLETSGGIQSEIAYLPADKFVGTSLDGIVYCLQEQSGEIVWRFSTGGRISQKAVLVGDSAYIVTTEGNLFSLSLDKGEQRWWTNYVRKVLSVSNNRLYVVDRANRLVILDAASGTQLGAFRLGEVPLSISNMQTDRIYLASNRGMIQCLHEEQQEFPIPHAGAIELKQQPKKQEKPAGRAKAAPMPAGNNNPFGGAGGGGNAAGGGGGGNNPFGAGGGGGNAGGNAGGGNNPFGTGKGGGSGGANKGGGGNNPFGTGNGGNNGGAKKGGSGNNPFGN